MKKYSFDDFIGQWHLDLLDYDKDLFLEVCHMLRKREEIPLVIFTKVANR